MPKTARSPWLLWGWLIGGLLYTYVVVTVERVDYYMYLLLPLAALTGGAFIGRVVESVSSSSLPRATKYAAAVVAAIFFVLILQQNRGIAEPYYAYKKSVYRNAIALDKTLKPNSIIVMGHYDPSVLYYIGRYGWE